MGQEIERAEHQLAMDKWLKRKVPGDPPTPNKKSSLAASVARNVVEKSRPLKKPSPPTVTTVTVVPSTLTATVLLPNSTHLAPRKLENRRGTSNNSILNCTSANSISRVPATTPTIRRPLLTNSKDTVLKPVDSIIQAVADKSDVGSRNVQGNIVESIPVPRLITTMGSYTLSLPTGSVPPLSARSADAILKKRIVARQEQIEIQTRATPSFLPSAGGNATKSTFVHNKRDEEKEKENEKEKEKEKEKEGSTSTSTSTFIHNQPEKEGEKIIAVESTQLEIVVPLNEMISSMSEVAAAISKAKDMDEPLMKVVPTACQMSERRILSEKNDGQVGDIVLSDSSDDEEDGAENDGARVSASSLGSDALSVSVPVLDLTLTPTPVPIPVHIPGTLGAIPIGAADILSELIAIRQQTLDDFIIAGGQTIQRAAVYTKNIPYPFIRDPAHYCGPMQFLNRFSFQAKV